MIRKYFWLSWLLLFIPDALTAYSPVPQFGSENSREEWQVERLDQGVYWSRYHGNRYNDAKLSINMVEVYLDSLTAELRIGHSDGNHEKTSKLGETNSALVAVNGSYFNMENGKPVTYLRSEGHILSKGAPANRFYTENGAICWDSRGAPVIIPRPEAGWDSVPYQHILSAGPLLLLDGEPLSFKEDSFHQNRHPRTAVALANHNRMIFITVDGRSFQSYGMTIPELATFLREMGAESALNLDGGGSTTMWIHGKEENGVVNYPSDNLEFDHQGERNVSNSLLLLNRNQQ